MERREGLTPAGTFLTAEWRDLVMLNYEVERGVVEPHVPAGCELDDWQGRTFLSVVGFRFLSTRLLGVPVPLHRSFEEVNLRLYVRQRHGDGWRRGVVFVKEIVPRRAVAWVARFAYGENYVALPMRHSIAGGPESATTRYEWRRAGRWEGLHARVAGQRFLPVLPEEGSLEAFITEHYWGFTRQRDGGTVGYEVEHPRWSVRRAADAALECDARGLYGQPFAEALAGPPTSAFVAEGSAVTVRRGRRIPAGTPEGSPHGVTEVS